MGSLVVIIMASTVEAEWFDSLLLYRNSADFLVNNVSILERCVVRFARRLIEMTENSLNSQKKDAKYSVD